MTDPVTLYLAGPMTAAGPQYAAAYESAAGQLRRGGFAVLSLHEVPAPGDVTTWEDWMRVCLGLLGRADGVAWMPGAGGTPVAELGGHVARSLIIPVRTIPAWLTQKITDDGMARLLAAVRKGEDS